MIPNRRNPMPLTLVSPGWTDPQGQKFYCVYIYIFNTM